MTKRFWRRCSGVLLALVLGIGTVFVGGSIAFGGGTTLTCWDWHILENPTYKLAYQEFERKYNVKLIISSVPWADMVKKQLLAARAGTLPDVMEIFGAALVPELAEMGALEPLDPYIEKEGGEKWLQDNYLSYAPVRYKGKLYSMPMDATSFGMMYNLEHFSEAGLQTAPQTWEELREYAIKLTDQEKGQWGLTLNGADIESLGGTLSNFCLQNGIKFGKLSPGRTGRIKDIYELGMSHPEAIEAFQFVLDLCYKDKVVPSFHTSRYEVARERFSSGKASMILDGGWLIQAYQIRTPDLHFATSVLPMGKYRAASLGTGDTEVTFTANCKDKELGWEFVKFYTGLGVDLLFNNGVLRCWSYKPTASRVEFIGNPLIRPFLVIWDRSEPVYTQIPPQVSKALDTFVIWQAKAALGEVTPKEALETVAREWMDLYNEWEDKYGE